MNATQNIIYNLKNGSHDSEPYYRQIKIFTAKVMQDCEEQAGDLVDDYLAFLKTLDNSFKPIDRKEYLFEALLLGVYMQEYGGFAMGSDYPGMFLMKALGNMRKKGGFSKKLADYLRGRWGMILLMNEKYRTRFMFPSTTNFGRLLLWLEATAEFGPQSKKVKTWHWFFRSLTRIEASIYLSVLTQLAMWFTLAASRELGVYTTGVDGFTNKVVEEYKNREDAISVNKRSVEYHLNMVGAEVMNGVFSDRFQAKYYKVLLLPPCMRKPSASGCCAVATERGSICTGCNEDCAVNQLRKTGLQEGFEVLIMHHASRPPDWLSDPEKNFNTGIIGVACLTNLVTGGWIIQSLGLPAQCVVLDHCGCRHWYKEPISTALNGKELAIRLNTTISNCRINLRTSGINSQLLCKTA